MRGSKQFIILCALGGPYIVVGSNTTLQSTIDSEKYNDRTTLFPSSSLVLNELQLSLDVLQAVRPSSDIIMPTIRQ